MTNKYCLCLSGLLGKVVLTDLLQRNLNISLILTDRHSEEIITIAQKENIPIFVGNPRKQNIVLWCNQYNIEFDYILSINYLFMLEETFLSLVQCAINLHGSLLPKYRGRTPHVWAIINGEKYCGITAHLMNTNCDDGDIIKQIKIKINKTDTGAKILEKYNKMYPVLVNEIIDKIETKTLSFTKQDITKATYFGKRTPEDGHINWQWQKERIYNWVRALANPYPGAFTFIRGKKIIINKISFSDIGFKDTTENGTIIKITNKPIVKTPNGAIKLLDFITDTELKQGDILI